MDEKLERLMIRHKKKIASAGFSLREIIPKEDLGKLMTILKYQAQEISLVISNFKCQKCGKESYLQFHHLILRKAKEFMNQHRYVTQRYYWANIIILCRVCHGKYHQLTEKQTLRDTKVISEERIKKLKEKYGKTNI